MGRLFWKFFFFVWVAQLTTVLGVTTFYWWEHRQRAAEWQQETGQHLPPPGFFQGGPPLHGGERPPRPPRPPGPHLPLAPLITGFIGSLVFAALLARYFSQPIRTLRGAFSEVAAGRLERRISGDMTTRGDELADLGRDFDHMAERLQLLVNGQRRLLHDVSHELRSPLARLQAAIDLAYQQPERQAELCARIERESQRMDTLVGELLTLSRLDTRMDAGVASDEPIDIGELLAGIVADAEFEARSRAIGVEFHDEGAGGVQVRGDGELLHRAIENVVRNALKYSPDGDRIAITVGVEAVAGQLRIAVEDAGPGVGPGDLEAIFEPFNRGSQPRDNDGHGLGLAIARRVVAAMGGRISAGNRAAGGLRIDIVLPLPQQPEI